MGSFPEMCNDPTMFTVHTCNNYPCVYCHLQILPDIIQGCKMSSTGGKKKKKVTKANSLGKVGELEKLLIGVLICLLSILVNCRITLC